MNKIGRALSHNCRQWRFHPVNKAWSHEAYWCVHHTLQATLQLNTPSNYLSGLGEELMLWPPNAWKMGRRARRARPARPARPVVLRSACPRRSSLAAGRARLRSVYCVDYYYYYYYYYYGE